MGLGNLGFCILGIGLRIVGAADGLVSSGFRAFNPKSPTSRSLAVLLGHGGKSLNCFCKGATRVLYGTGFYKGSRIGISGLTEMCAEAV